MPPENAGKGPAAHAAEHANQTAASEAEFLSRQVADAKAAIARTIADLKGEAGHVVNPADLTRKHPWMSVGATAVAGFVAAMAVVPSKEQQALRRLAAIEAALRPQPAKAESNGQHKTDGKEPSSWIQTLLRELIKSLGPVVAALVSNLTAPPQPADPAQTQDGQTAATATSDAGH